MESQLQVDAAESALDEMNRQVHRLEEEATTAKQQLLLAEKRAYCEQRKRTNDLINRVTGDREEYDRMLIETRSQIDAADRPLGQLERQALLAEHQARLTAHRSVLETAKGADPALVEAYLVYADWLQESGEPYGELIAVQHALLLTPDDDHLRQTERRLLDQLCEEMRPWPTWNVTDELAENLSTSRSRKRG